MKTRTLGKNGPKITVIGLGTWAIGGPWIYGWGPQDDDKSAQAIRAALDTGINWIDTAATYGFGHSEKVVGSAVKDCRDSVFLATKCGRTWDDDGNSFFNLRPESIRKEMDDSLLRLGVDHVDLYQIHWPDRETGTPIEESWGVMKELQDAGKTRYIGVSNFDVPLLEKCMKIAHVQSLQPPFNLIRREAGEELLPYCHKNGIGIVAYSPMQSGLLTGKFDINRLAPDDWRRNSAVFQEPNLTRNLEFVERLRPVAEGLGKTVGQIAVAWVLSQTGITSAIVGARNADQASQNAEAAFDLPEDALDEINKIAADYPPASIGRI